MKAAPEHRSSEPSTKRAGATDKERMLEKFPWAKDFLPEDSRATGGRRAPARPPQHGNREEITDEMIQEAWDEVMAKRRELHLAGGDETADFSTKILGSRWTRINKGKSCDAVIGIASGGAAREWCRLYGLNVEASFAIGKYGEGDATMMALEWCRRRQHFYDLYVEADRDDYAYSGEELQSCPEKLEWVHWLLARGTTSVCWSRALEVQSSMPSTRPVEEPTSNAASSSKDV